MRNYWLLVFLTAFIIGATAQEQLRCKLPAVNITQKWITLSDPCSEKMRDQVKEELRAAMIYLSMGAHFANDKINRPGFSKMFFQSASEERSHAIKIIEYLVMRGAELDLSNLIKQAMPITKTWNTGIEALRAALDTEIEVTAKINDIIKVCESSPSKTGNKDLINDYHLVDYLTTDFLDEQLKGQREIAGRISTLGKMVAEHGALGEFLYDKKLLE